MPARRFAALLLTAVVLAGCAKYDGATPPTPEPASSAEYEAARDEIDGLLVGLAEAVAPGVKLPPRRYTAGRCLPPDGTASTFFTPGTYRTDIAAPSGATERTVLRRARAFFDRQGFRDLGVPRAAVGSSSGRELRAFADTVRGRLRIGFWATGRCSQAREADVDLPSEPGPRKPGSEGPTG